ncbi:MAG: hypothetical protein EOM11_10905, partial [Erysipelotrichia bacterium]|nr:hypothetical protein [Erysipelotrichia bacterium]
MVLKGKQKYIHYTDYEIQQPFSNYMNITFHQFIYNEKGEKLIEQIHIINYDKKANKILSLEDVFRKDYQNMIATILRKENKAYTTDSISQFKIDKDGITLYFNNEIEQFVHLIYSQIPSYIKLKDEHIASLFQIQPQPTVDELVDPNKAMVAFTFDDGPSESYTKAIMDAFDKVDGKATFFMLGSQASKYGNIVKEVDKRGFEIANHTYNHKNLQALSDEEAYQEIMSTQDILYSYTGKESRFLRSPYGNNPKLDLSDTNIKTVLWNLDTLDWKSRNSEAIKNNIRKNIHDGSIILLHDIYPASAKAIKEILPELKKQGYQFVS